MKYQWKILPILGVIIKILSGLILLSKPEVIAAFLPIVTGILLLIIALIRIFYYCITDTNKTELWIQNLFGIFLSILLILKQDATYTFLGYIFGMWTIVSSIIKISMAITQKINHEHFIFKLFEGVIEFVIGFFFLFNPFKSLTYLAILIGIYFILSAIDTCITFFLFKKFLST